VIDVVERGRKSWEKAARRCELELEGEQEDPNIGWIVPYMRSMQMPSNYMIRSFVRKRGQSEEAFGEDKLPARCSAVTIKRVLRVLIHPLLLVVGRALLQDALHVVLEQDEQPRCPRSRASFSSQPELFTLLRNSCTGYGAYG
jgi:hypothetical protein